MKLTLRQKIRLMYGLMIGGAVLALLGAYSGVGGGSVNGVLVALGFGVLIAGAVLEHIWHRCPSCGEHLGRGGFPKFCPHCGKEIDYDVKKS